jgi:type IV secretory pathway TrbF-like protein
MPNYSLAYTTAITATYSDTNAVQSPFVVKTDADWTNCIPKPVNFNGATADITRTQLQHFFSNTGTVSVDGTDVAIRTHMVNLISATLGADATKDSLIDAYNLLKAFNQQVERVEYTFDTDAFNTALTDNTDIVDVSGVADGQKFRLLFSFESSVPTIFRKSVGIEWNVNGA